MSTWFVPGRIEVFGKHTDYAGGNVLVAAVDHGVTVTAKPTTRQFTARSEHGEPVELAPHAPTQLPAGHWGRYVHTVLARLTADFGTLTPAEITVSSDLPLASGMSSSSALLIGVALAIADQNGLKESPTWRENIRTDLDLAAYLASIENGTSFKHLSGGSGVGTNGGSEDHAAILTGIPDHLLQYNFDPMALNATVKVPDEWTFVVATCGVTAEKTGTALHDYNRCSSEIRQIVTLAKHRHNLDYTNLHAMLRDNGDAWVHNLVADSPALTRRLNHFLIESQQVVPEAVRAFQERDSDLLGDIAARSQQAARDLLGNQLHETSQLVQSAAAVGAFAASSFGAGFGGSVWALVHADRASDFTDHWLRHYRNAVPEAGTRAIALRVQASGPARLCG